MFVNILVLGIKINAVGKIRSVHGGGKTVLSEGKENGLRFIRKYDCQIKSPRNFLNCLNGGWGKAVQEQAAGGEETDGAGFAHGKSFGFELQYRTRS